MHNPEDRRAALSGSHLAGFEITRYGDMDIVETGTWRVVTRTEDFDALRPAWERLFVENPKHSAFLSWGWADAWLRHIAGEHELHVVCLDDTDGDTRFILPLHRPTGGFHVWRGKLQLVGGYGLECSDNLGCLRSPDLDERTEELVLAAFERHFGAADALSLAYLDSSDGFPERFAARIRKTGRHVRIRPDATCPATSLPGDWDEFLAGLSSNFRAQVRRSFRSVGGDGAPQFRRVAADDAAAFTSELIRLNRSRFRSKGRRSSLEDATMRAFLGDAVPYLASEGIAWMDTIEHDGATLGSALHFVHGDTVSFYMGGFDERAGKLRPGVALFALVMQRAIEQGCRRFDFLRGDEAYKYRWQAADVATHEVVAYGRGVFRGPARSATDKLYLHTRNLLKNIYYSVSRQGR